MLSETDNERLTRVGPGTPMGALLREFWIPVMLEAELEPDGRPQRVRLLGEDLIAFRDSAGRPGLLADNCPHRGASLFFGRNEEEGLRCVYHGWKFDVSGRCVEMPNEPAESTSLPGPLPYEGRGSFKDKVHATAYPCREAGGIVWTYMGPRPQPPPLPEYELIGVDASRRIFPYRMLRDCNWLQALEGCFDPSHVFFLHSRLHPEDPPSLGPYHADRSPRLEIVQTDYGLMFGARRDQGDADYYWRVTQYTLPFLVMYPGFDDGVIPGHIWVPLDDEHTLNWDFRYHPSRPFTAPELAHEAQTNRVGYQPPTSEAFSRWRSAGTSKNDYLIDREVQRTKTFTGIPVVPLQDQAVTESMGTIFDRTREHLGTSDAVVIQLRQCLLSALRAHSESGAVPPSVDHPALNRVRSASAVLPRDVSWEVALDAWLHARDASPAALPRV